MRLPTPEVEEIRLPTFLSVLTKKYGSEWVDLEDETVSLDMGLTFTPILVDKINVLRIMVMEPDMFYEDFLFFCHAVDVFNNIVADFSSIPYPNSLEIAWAVTQAKQVVEGEFSYEVKRGVTKLLIEEGFSSAPGPLLEVCFPEDLVPGQEIEDRQAKEEAISQYISHMEKST